jgi:hypothetical protein
MITTCTTSTSEALASVTEIRSALGLTPDSTEDGWIETAILRASAAAETFLGQPVRLQVYSETVAGYGTGRLMVSRTPIQSVLRLFNSTSTETAISYASSEVRVDDAEAGLIAFVDGSAPSWSVAWRTSKAGGDLPVPGSEATPWLVEYSAGYSLDGSSSTEMGLGSTGRTLPYDLEEAVQDTVVAWYRARGRDPLVLQRKVGDLSVTYADPSAVGGASMTGLTPRAKALLGPYRRLA